MKRELVLAIALLLLSSSISAAKISVKLAGAADSYAVHNIDTGLNYTTIQSAIDANETLDGHTISVDQGIYYEHLTINKSLSLIGENISTTIIDGNFTGDPVTIAASYVNITSFTIQEAWWGTFYIFEGCAICISPDTAYNNISHNIITNNKGYGIIINSSSHNIISDNFVGYNFGITMIFSNNNTVANNIIHNSSGVMMTSSHSNTIFNNKIENCSEGIGVFNSTGNMIHDNTISDGYLGIGLGYSEHNRLYNNNMTGNIYNFLMNEGQTSGITKSHFNNSIEIAILLTENTYTFYKMPKT